MQQAAVKVAVVVISRTCTEALMINTDPRSLLPMEGLMVSLRNSPLPVPQATVRLPLPSLRRLDLVPRPLLQLRQMLPGNFTIRWCP